MNINNLQNLGENLPDPLAGCPKAVLTLLQSVFHTFNIDERLLAAIWWRDDWVERARGVVAAVELVTGVQCVTANVQMISRKAGDRMLSIGEVLNMLVVTEDAPGDFVLGINEAMITLQCYRLVSFQPGTVAQILDDFQEELDEIRDNLKLALAAVTDHNPDDLLPTEIKRLPKIKTYPHELAVIMQILGMSEVAVQETMVALIEKWAARGGIVTTTSSMICLEIPYGSGQIRLAFILPKNELRPPSIGLAWASLKQLKGLPQAALARYYQDVQRLTLLRITQSAAYIAIDPLFTRTKLLALVKAMKTLADKIDITKAEAPHVSQPRTEPNLDATMQACPPDIQALYSYLVAGWRQAQGQVACPRPGRIYLRLKTKAHHSGISAQRAHQFNLLVLAAPNGKRGSLIQVYWHLAAGGYGGYLDDIPEAVKQFESVVSELPGFEQSGTLTRLILSPNFTRQEAEKLLTAVLALKLAAEAGDPPVLT